MSEFHQTITSLNLLYTSLYRMELFTNAQGVNNVKTDVISLISRLEKAERERDDLRSSKDWYEEAAKGLNSRLLKAKAELSRRDAAAGEPDAEIKWDGEELTVQNIRVGFGFGVTPVYSISPPPVEPVAYAVFSDNGNIRIWSTDKNIPGNVGVVQPLYTAAPPAVLPVVKLPPLPTGRAITSAPYSLTAEHMAIRAMDIIAIREAGIEVVDE